MQTPINHHYVHESYQKRFRSSESKLYVILREHRNVVKETTPARTCYEPNLNTLIYEANQFKEIEEFYKNVESIFSNLLILFDSFTKVEKGSADDFLKIEEAQYIFKIMIALMFWRNPNHLEHAELYFDKILELYDESQVTINEFVNIDRETIEDLHKNNKDKNVKKIIQYLFLPILTFEIVNSKSPILCAEIEDDFFITCDKPIIFQGALEKLFLFENFYWPIDSRRLIVSKDFFEQNLSIEDINLSSALNAKKYILGGNREYLEYLSQGLSIWEKGE